MQSDHVESTRNDTTARPDLFIRLIPSRREALESLKLAALASPPHPILITGEPGAGKSALVLEFAAQAPVSWRIATIDLSAEMTALDFLRLAGQALGVPSFGSLGKARIRIHDALADDFAEGRRWLLVASEAHRASAAVWDELQAIANQLGRPRGFAAIFVVGATELPRLLASQRRTLSLAGQISIHIHLKPIDLDEARMMLEAIATCTPVDERALEVLHRDSRGNPTALLRLAELSARKRRLASHAPALGQEQSARTLGHADSHGATRRNHLNAEASPDLAHEVVREATPSTRSTTRGPGRAEAPALIPSKPPIRDEEGLVEVGWEGDLEDDLAVADSLPTHDAGTPSHDSRPSEESIEDHYAALQALAEREAWSTQGQPARDAYDGFAAPAVSLGGSAESAEPGHYSASPSAPGSIRAEGQHEFAPYSQLFTRFRQSK